MSFFEKISMFTNMKHAKITAKSLGTTTNKIAKFLGISMLIEIHALPRITMYWKTITRVPIMTNNMGKNRYFKEQIFSCVIA